MPPIKPYTGLIRKLVIAFDVGTTFSGASYALLEPGRIPEVRSVTRYPAQEHVGGDSKIPSILYYDSRGAVRAIGAEALQESIIEQAEDQEWTKIEWFKLHLRPKGLDTKHIRNLPLPSQKSIVGVYADFLSYLLTCTKAYIEDTHANGQALWDEIENSVNYVITHPNGWEGREQALLRRAAAEAGLVPDDLNGQGRIQFLTEGEASLHFCAQNGLNSDAILSPGRGITILDAGGGTIDVSAFAALKDGCFEEISVAQCHFQGSVFVTQRAKDFLEDKFRHTKFAADVQNMADVFDKSTKLRFRNEDAPSYIKFGGLRDKDPTLNIRAGQLTLDGTDVAQFFRPSIDAMIEAVLTQHRSSRKPISSVFLVGGFAASDYVFSALKAALEPLDITVSRPDGHVNKAVADGAVGFHLKKLVSRRIARFDIGTDCSAYYDPCSMESRSHLVYRDLKGDEMVPGWFRRILRKGTQVKQTQSFSRSFSLSARSPSSLNWMDAEIRCYRGYRSPCPSWIDVDEENFMTYCVVTADISKVPKPAQMGPLGLYYTVNFDVNITFGPAEMNAYLSWEENGAEKRGPASIIYEDM